MRARGRSRARALAAALTGSLMLAIPAHAQLGDVGEDVLDTEQTPVAKESVKWEWWAGARYNGAPKPSDVPQGSATPFELDFFDVAFHDLNTGFAGGAICREPAPERASAEEARAHTDTCERVPALYRYSVDEAGTASWSSLDLGASAKRRGYVGAIAWLDSDTALAVGGDGCYPRREEPCPDGDTPPGDPAGMARAWLYDGGSVSELTDLPEEMRGLTALGTHSGGAFAGALRQIWRFQDGAFVTGWSGDGSAPQEVRYPELFQFRVRDLRGATAVTAGCCRTDPLQSAGPRLLTFDGSTWAVTRRRSDFSNATGALDEQSTSEPLGDPLPGAFGSVEGAVETVWDGGTFGDRTWPGIQQTLANAWREIEDGAWASVRKQLDKNDNCQPQQFSSATPPTLPCLYAYGWYSPAGNPFPNGLGDTTGFSSYPIDLPNNLVDDPKDPSEPSVLGPFGLGSPPDLGPAPDVLPPPPGTSDVRDPVNDTYRNAFGQLYGATKFLNGWSIDGHSVNTHTQAQEPDSYYALSPSLVGFGTVASPGGPSPGPGEDEPGSVVSNGPSLLLTTARIVSADQSPVTVTGSDSNLEAVGVLRSSGRGALVGRWEREVVQERDLNNLHHCNLPSAENPEVPNPLELCDPDANGYIAAQASSRLFKLDSYALNAIDVVEGAGWAVGDHGAIQSREPPPPPPPTPPAPPARAGAKLESESVSSKAFEEHRPPLTDEPGIVPALAGQPQVRSAQPDFQGPYGPAISQGEVVMSRDGSEGWALDRFAGKFLRYDGGRWEPCDPVGVPNLLPPDPACAELGKIKTQINAVARIPLERDADPSNDDSFEAVALTSGAGLYRYHEGRWSRDKDATYELFGHIKPVEGSDIAFTAADDGWVIGGVSDQSVEIFHFDGERWAYCNFEPQACDDPGGRLTIGPPCVSHKPAAQLAVAGERVYLIATRDVVERAGGVNVCSLSTPQWQGEPYPLILYHDRGSTWQGGVDPDWQDGVDTTPEDGYNPTDGGWDPGCARTRKQVRTNGKVFEVCDGTGERADQGQISSISVAQNADGSYQGWAFGAFGGRKAASADTAIMRLSDGRDALAADEMGTEKWRYWRTPDAAADYLRYYRGVPFATPQVTLPREATAANSFLFELAGTAPALAFDQGRARWGALATPWAATAPNSDLSYTTGDVTATAPDGQGGFWAMAKGGSYHYTDHAPKPVFEDTPDPARGVKITAFAAAANGTVWLGDEQGLVYRYDRLAGWSRPFRIPGWDPKQTTNPTGISAIAVGPDGKGIALGPGGRIAMLGDEVGLDAAATVACGTRDAVPPCGTAKDLFAAAVAPDGSALVLGKENTLLWRSSDGDFRSIDPPPAALSARTAIEMPRGDRAYLLTESSQVLRGEMTAPGDWRWEFELGDAEGKPDPLTDSGRTFGLDTNVYRAIRDIAIDASGRGYAVGNGGLVLERAGDRAASWRRIASGLDNNLQQVTLPAGSGKGALIAGENGLIVTLTDRGFDVARHPDILDPLIANGDGLHGGFVASRYTGLALLPGYRAGDVEAWALLQGQRFEQATHSLLHYASAPAHPLLDPARALVSLPQAPDPASGEISFAAFGKQDCDGTNRSRQRGGGDLAQRSGGAFPVRDACGPPDGSNVTPGLINRRIAEDLTQRGAQGAAAQFALFTGDAIDAPGVTPTGEGATVTGGPFPITTAFAQTPLDGDLKHRRWVELVANPLVDTGTPLLGALGGQDLARQSAYCTGAPGEAIREIVLGGCGDVRQVGVEQFGVRQGVNLPWRAAMAFSPAPWEEAQEGGGLRFEPVGGGALSTRGPDSKTPEGRSPAPSDIDPRAQELDRNKALVGPSVHTEPYPIGSGDTHYATDVIDEETDERITRIVVVDTSMRSLAASDPQQHPIEAGGQLRWLEEMLCFEGSAADTDGDVLDCTREEGQRAIVVSNAPTYSYGPISPEELHQGDAAVFESVLIKNQVDVVVSGGVGWNGRYWTIAPGLHSPCPGQAYRSDSDPPSATSPEICGQGGGSADPGEQLSDAEAGLTREAGGSQTPASDLAEQVTGEAEGAAGLATRGAIPTVVSSSAGGTFNTKAERGGFATAENGFWRGYSLIRLHPSGDPSKTIVEQRPILDWVGLEAKEQELEPRAEVDVRGYAREAFGMDTLPRYYDIPDHEGITHRYHLLLAHPKEPWRACEAGDSECEAVHEKLSTGVSGLALQQRAAATQDLTPSEGAGENPCDPYLCLPERVGTIEPITGEVSAGNGKYPDTIALATLSVGEHVAVQPLVFTRSPSFVLSALGQPPEVPAPGANLANAPTAPAPPPAPKPPIPQVNTPEPPLPPAVPPITATQPPEPQPPAPPAPPPPTDQPSPLSLTLAPPGITVATPTAVIQPPTPPVNPAPPGGARREARQRQAATQKSGADSSEGTEETQSSGGDLAQAPPRNANAATRHAHGSRHEHSFTALERRRTEPSFTALNRETPSATAQGLLYGGGITLMALALALGYTHGRPTPRRRTPEAPAPAFSRARIR